MLVPYAAEKIEYRALLSWNVDSRNCVSNDRGDYMRY